MKRSKAEELAASVRMRLNPDKWVDVLVEDAMASENPGSTIIEGIEAHGQREFVYSDVLPADMQGNREAFEKMGIVFGELSGDRVFITCQLPKGWQKRATDHAMWSELIDEQQRVRASIFFKASPHDYSAHMDASLKLSVEVEEVGENGYRGVLKDNDGILYQSYVCEFEGERYDKPAFYAKQKAKRMAVDVANINYPDWQKAWAYWDVDLHN